MLAWTWNITCMGHLKTSCHKIDATVDNAIITWWTIITFWRRSLTKCTVCVFHVSISLSAGPLQQVVWVCVRHVRLGSSVQRVLQRKQRQQGRTGVSALPQRDHSGLWRGTRAGKKKKELAEVTTYALITHQDKRFYPVVSKFKKSQFQRKSWS